MGALLYDPQKSSLRTRVDFALPINEIGVGGCLVLGVLQLRQQSINDLLGVALIVIGLGMVYAAM